jgi:transposase-like protein
MADDGKADDKAETRWVGTAEVAREFGVHEDTARAWIKRGVFGEPFRPNARTMLIARDAFDRVRRAKTERA